MGERDPRVDAYIKEAAPFARPILAYIREAAHAGCPDLHEDMKWNAPYFMYKGMLCGMAAFTRHCAFGFWKSPWPGGGVGSTGATERFVRIESISDLPPKKALIRLVQQAAQLNDDGVKAPARPAGRARAALPVPAGFMSALRKNKRALGTFENFSPSQRREYVEWVTEAKTEPTRARRVATSVEWLAEGRIRNWKYTPKK